MIKFLIRFMRSISRVGIHVMIVVHKEEQHTSQVHHMTIFPGTSQSQDDLSHLMTLTIITW